GITATSRSAPGCWTCRPAGNLVPPGRRSDGPDRAGRESQPQHVVHGVPPRLAVGEEAGRLDGAAGVAVAGVRPVRQLQRLAQRAENNRVLADVVADADGVDADLVGRPLADQPLAAVAQVGLAHRLLHDAGEVQRRAAGRVLLEAVVPLQDLDVE